MKKILILILLFSCAAVALDSEKFASGEFNFKAYGYINNGHINMRVPYETDYQKSTISGINKDDNGGFVRAYDKFAFEGTVTVDYSKIRITNDEKIEKYNVGFLGKTENIYPDSQKVKDILDDFKSENILETVKQVTEFAYHFIGYDASQIGKDPFNTDKIFKEKRGVCVEYAILTASILRAKGIPTKYIIGFVLAGEEFEPHAWVEFYTKEYGWLPADPTKNQMVHIDATHIKIAEGSDPSELYDKIRYYGSEANYKKEYSTVIKSSKNFPVLDSTISVKPDQIYFSSSADLEVSAKNPNDEMKFVSTLVLHDEFTNIENPSRIIIIKPKSTEIETWKIQSNDAPIHGKIITHTLRLKSQAMEGETQLAVSESYKQNTYNEIQIKKELIKEENRIQVSATVKNTGNEDIEGMKVSVIEVNFNTQEQEASLNIGEEKKFDFYFVPKPDVKDYNFLIKVEFNGKTLVESVDTGGIASLLKTENLIYGFAGALALFLTAIIIKKLRK